MKLWGGRFEKQTEEMVDDFHSSISFDFRLYKHDILGSIAHVHMLGECNIISKEDAQKITQGLLDILKAIESGEIQFRTDAEDIHMNIEALLIQRIGDVGKKLHTGRSRNDQIALDMRMYVKDSIIEVTNHLSKLGYTLLEIAEKNVDTILPGYTHLQKAQPITLAHHLMAYFQMFIRDIQRFQDCLTRVDVMPLGSGALAATTYPLDRQMVADILGFSKISSNSLDAVSDRDFCIEFISAASITMMHLSRFCEELILWSTHEFQFVEMDDSYSTGSSIMPQKKNPDVAELIRGKTGRVYGDLISLLTTMKSLPLAYNKDMQEDKEAFFDARDTLLKCLKVFTGMLRTLIFRKENMLQGAKGGFTNATDAADYLVKKGLPFRTAHEIIGKLVLHCIKKQKDLLSLSLEEFQSFSSLFDEDIFDAISLDTCVNERKLPGGPSRESMTASIKEGYEYLRKITSDS